MEFRFRASDARSLSLLRSSTSSSSIADVVMSSLQSQPFSAGGINDSLSQPASEEEKLKREVLKEQIRKEILRDMAERRLIEEQVRREIELEHALTFASKRNIKIDGGLQQQGDVTLGRLMDELLPQCAMAFGRGNVDGRQHCNDGVYIRPEVMDAAASTVITKRGPKRVCSIETERKATCVGAISKLPRIQKDWRCTHCQVSATSKEGLDEHLNGKKHKAMRGPTKVCSIDTKKAKCMGAIPKLSRMEKDWNCSLCQISAPSKQGLDEHLNGKKHKAKKMQLALKKKPVEFGGGLTSMQKIAWRCSICLVCTTSEKTLNDHVKSRKHKAKEALLATLRRSAEIDYESTSMLNKNINEYIEVGVEKATGRCPKISGSTSMPNDSIGKALIMDAAEKKIASTASVGSTDKEEDGMTGAQLALKMKVKKCEFYCILCKLKCYSKLSLEAHLGGRKHKNQLAGLRLGV